MFGFSEFLKSRSIKIRKENIEHRIFPFHFFLLTLVGQWHPQSATSNIRFLFKIFLCIAVIMQTILIIEIGIHFINLFQVTDMFTLCIFISGMYKFIRFSQKRKNLISILTEYIPEKSVKSKNDEEEEIIKKSQVEIRFDKYFWFI